MWGGAAWAEQPWAEHREPDDRPMRVYMDTIGSGTATGNKAYAGLGFQPKAIIFWTTAGATPGTVAASCAGGIGFCTAVGAEFGIGWFSEDGVADSNCSRTHAAACVNVPAATETVLMRATLASFDPDGFTLNWSTAPGASRLIHFLALGGSDLTNAAVKEWAIPTATDAAYAVTGVGFKPDCVIHISIAHATTGTQIATELRMMLGMMTGVGAEGVADGYSTDAAATSDTQGEMGGGLSIARATAAAGNDLLGSLVSLDSDGFTLNMSGVPGTADKIFSLCLKGGSYAVVSENVDIDLGSDHFPTADSLTFTPIAYLIQGKALTTVPNVRWSMGGSDGTREGSSWCHDQDAQVTMSANRLVLNDKAMQFTNAAGADVGRGDHGGFGFGYFDINWSTAPVAAYPIVALAIGAAKRSFVFPPNYLKPNMVMTRKRFVV